MAKDGPLALRQRPGFWAGLFFGCVGAIAGLRLSDAVNPATSYILFVIAFGLLIPMARTIRRSGSAACGASHAVSRYTTGIMASGFAYVLGLGFAITIDKRMELEGASGFLVALLPVLPIFWMIYVMGRYLVEEQDEFLRHRAIIASLIGLGLLLAIGSFWGFLETFGMVPHMPGWWAVPIWAVGMGLGQAWQSLGDRRGAER